MSKTATASPTVAPPEEAFWTRYSPHGEFPLSSVASAAGHILLFALFILGGWLVARLNWGTDKAPVPVVPVVMDDSGPAGGGGHPKGHGPGAGLGDPKHSGDAAVEETDTSPPADAGSAAGEPSREKLQEARKEALKFEEFSDPTAQRLIEEGGPQVDTIIKLSKDTRDKLAKGLAQAQPIGPGIGRGGPGSGGGAGTGVGQGTGDGIGTGTIKRQERVLRWTLIFNTLDGNDYAAQLRGLGAILAVPDPASPGSYLAIEDLNERPVRPVRKDLSEIKRIYWIDDRHDSVASLARALGLSGVPPHIVAFFPTNLEKKLLELELNYRGKREDQIRETRFELRRSADGYTPRVTFQR